MNKLKIEDILKKKKKEKITMLTCYDYSFAEILDEVGLDIILVGDSLANVILGMNQTRKVGVREMLAHTKAVARAVKHSLVVADMPYISYQKNPKKCVYYAEKFIEAGADAVKIEWFKDCPYVVRRIVKNKIPVMGHIGLTPQTVHLLGGYKVQGKDRKSALNLITQAKILERLGVFSIVLECIPYQVSQVITNQLKIPTIGIGAGKYCDGQVLVLYDLLNLYKKIKPKFVRIYADLHKEVKVAIAKFIIEVKNEKFPTLKESFSIKKEELRDFIKSNE
jgi:3-methyl-2-oxobutanoate hydroxymethyltransferase